MRTRPGSRNDVEFHAFNRGSSYSGGRLVGYVLECQRCWNRWKINDNRRAAEREAREHVCPEPRIVLETELNGFKVEFRAVETDRNPSYLYGFLVGLQLVVLVDAEKVAVVFTTSRNDRPGFCVCTPGAAFRSRDVPDLEGVADTIAEILSP